MSTPILTFMDYSQPVKFYIDTEVEFILSKYSFATTLYSQLRNLNDPPNKNPTQLAPSPS